MRVLIDEGIPWQQKTLARLRAISPALTIAPR